MYMALSLSFVRLSTVLKNQNLAGPEGPRVRFSPGAWGLARAPGRTSSS